MYYRHGVFCCQDIDSIIAKERLELKEKKLLMWNIEKEGLNG